MMKLLNYFASSKSAQQFIYVTAAATYILAFCKFMGFNFTPSNLVSGQIQLTSIVDAYILGIIATSILSILNPKIGYIVVLYFLIKFIHSPNIFGLSMIVIAIRYLDALHYLDQENGERGTLITL